MSKRKGIPFPCSHLTHLLQLRGDLSPSLGPPVSRPSRALLSESDLWSTGPWGLSLESQDLALPEPLTSSLGIACLPLPYLVLIFRLQARGQPFPEGDGQWPPVLCEEPGRLVGLQTVTCSLDQNCRGSGPLLTFYQLTREAPNPHLFPIQANGGFGRMSC